MNETPHTVPPPRAGGRVSPVAVGAMALAIGAWIVLGLSGPGTRAELWHFRTAFRMLSWGAYLGIAALVLGIVAALVTRPGTRRRGFGVALVAVLLGALAFWLPWNWRNSARGAPPIHDVTTDVADPPAFVAVAPLRADAPNPVEYAGDSVAVLQREAYPDVQPVVLRAAPGEAFQMALAAAREMGWEIVAAEPGEGRIEATATTTWFGFLDDVAIRVAAEGSGSRVDVRSKSRVGRGDAGANAARIRKYTQRLRRHAGEAAP
jgi:uncharacterized protein (DUF1499 family)